MTVPESDKVRIAVLESQLEEMLRREKEQDDSISDLLKWKQYCNTVAAGWGGVCMAATTIGAAVYGYWETISKLISGAHK